MNLAKINLTDMSSHELTETNGGGWLRKTIIGYLATEVIENWDSLKKGIREGYADATAE